MSDKNKLEILRQVKDTFRQSLNIEPPDAHMDLFDSGGLDSLMFVTLLEALERDFNITIDLGKVDLEQFQSLSTITTFIAANCD